MVRGLRFQLLLLVPPLPLLFAKVPVRNEQSVGSKKDRFLKEERTSGFILPKDVSRAATAIRLSETVHDGHKKKKDDDDNNRDDLPQNLTTGIYLESGIDAVYLARVGDDYCAAAFRGTTSFQPGDWFTNLDIGPVELEGDLFVGCDVHRGYYEAYADFEYREEVEDFLQSCRAECPECETVLTGHSQGGGIAEIAALFLKSTNNISSSTSSHNKSLQVIPTIETNDGNDPNFENTTDNRISPYVVTFAAPPSLGAGCLDVFSEDERRRWFRYLMATEGAMGTKLVYDPIPLLYAQLLSSPPDDDDVGFFDIFAGFDFDASTTSLDKTYARNGGLAFIGHEILLSTEDPSAVFLSDFDGHRYVDLKYIDLSGEAHYDDLYSKVLQTQDKIYRNSDEKVTDDACSEMNGDTDYDDGSYTAFAECPAMHVPSGGFAEGSLCNEPDDSSARTMRPLSSVCVEGTTCEAESKWLFWDSARHTCQRSTVSITSAAPSEGETGIAEDASSTPVAAPTANLSTSPVPNPATNRMTNQILNPTRKQTSKVVSMIADTPIISSGVCHRPLPTRLRQTTASGHLLAVSSMIAAALVNF